MRMATVTLSLLIVVLATCSFMEAVDIPKHVGQTTNDVEQLQLLISKMQSFLAEVQAHLNAIVAGNTTNFNFISMNILLA